MNTSTSRMERALARARAATAAELREGEGPQLVRADRAGDDVLLTFRAGRGHLWVRCSEGKGQGEGEVETLSLQRDEALPIAARLQEVARSGPLEVLSYRPGRRLTLRQDTARGPRVLKAYRRKRFEGAIQRHVTAALAVEGSSFRVPPLTGRDDALACLTMRDLGRAELQLARLSPQWFARVGRALRSFQAMRPDIRLPGHGLAEELAVLDRARRDAEFLTGAIPDGWDQARAALERVGERLEPRRPVLTHRDLHDGQLHPAEDDSTGIGLLDFDLLCTADPALDVANLSAHLELRALQGRVDEARAQAWSEAFCAGHGCATGEPWFRLLRAAALLRLALVYLVRPRWAHLSPELTRRAGRMEEALRGAV